MSEQLDDYSAKPVLRVPSGNCPNVNHHLSRSLCLGGWQEAETQQRCCNTLCLWRQRLAGEAWHVPWHRSNLIQFPHYIRSKAAIWGNIYCIYHIQYIVLRWFNSLITHDDLLAFVLWFQMGYFYREFVTLYYWSDTTRSLKVLHWALIIDKLIEKVIIRLILIRIIVS